ncbi:hypothetical protein B0T20DRAFT_247859 [Sordaria brevicollis]|uniref:Uncharacterized protein n=1 Tax=Sordaria brevicollis TaxID=83679 RepID=A0AAE0PBT0_SORBR|nr:hypothetical protein B0T20DRAFT_247859 [Sordaria brevicollis]
MGRPPLPHRPFCLQEGCLNSTWQVGCHWRTLLLVVDCPSFLFSSPLLLFLLSSVSFSSEYHHGSYPMDHEDHCSTFRMTRRHSTKTHRRKRLSLLHTSIFLPRLYANCSIIIIVIIIVIPVTESSQPSDPKFPARKPQTLDWQEEIEKEKKRRSSIIRTNA